MADISKIKIGSDTYNIKDSAAIKTVTTASGANINTVGTPSVSVSTSGTTITLTFDYLKGATGPQGPKGDTGPQGPKGDTGPAGSGDISIQFDPVGTSAQPSNNATSLGGKPASSYPSYSAIGSSSTSDPVNATTLGGYPESSFVKATSVDYILNEEQIMPEKWLNGKPIYRKMYYFSGLANNSNIIVDTSLTMSTVELLIDYKGCVVNGTTNMRPIPYWASTSDYIGVVYIEGQTGLRFKQNSSVAGTTVYLAVYYVKK